MVDVCHVLSMIKQLLCASSFTYVLLVLFVNRKKEDKITRMLDQGADAWKTKKNK